MNQKQKILMVNFEFPPIGGGGGKTHMRLLEEFSSNSNLDIDVLTSSPKPGLYEETFSENIRIIKVGIHKKDLHCWTKLETIEWLWRAGKIYKLMINRKDYDLAHCFFGFPTGWLGLRNKKKIPYMISLLGSDVPGANPRFKLDYKILAPLFKSIWKNASAITACSNGLRDRAKRFYAIPNINVITNGIDLTKFYPNHNPTNTQIKLLTTGRLSTSKHIEILIEAVSKMESQLTLQIVGGGSEKTRLHNLAKELNIESKIEFTDRVEPTQMPEIYRNADIYVCASETEGMSNSMLEAMASGLPIVTTEFEGVSELVKDNGIITRETTSESLARAVDSLLNDREKMKSMSKEAVSLASKFTWQNVAQDYISIYKTLL